MDMNKLMTGKGDILERKFSTMYLTEVKSCGIFHINGKRYLGFIPKTTSAEPVLIGLNNDEIRRLRDMLDYYLQPGNEHADTDSLL